MQNVPTPNNSIAAVLLSGGLSTRMGRDKALLHPYGDSTPNLLARTYSILESHFNNIWVSCAEGKERHGYACIFDAYKEIGPISGIYAGLLTAQKAALEGILVLPCDLPLVHDNIIQILLAARTKHRATNKAPYNLMTTFLDEKTKNIEALIAIYEVEALPLFARAIEDGIRAPRMVITEDMRTHIPYTESLKDAFFNLNTSDEYAKFQKKYAK